MTITILLETIKIGCSNHIVIKFDNLISDYHKIEMKEETLITK